MLTKALSITRDPGAQERSEAIDMVDLSTMINMIAQLSEWPSLCTERMEDTEGANISIVASDLGLKPSPSF